jgi:hypothetical protein
MRVESDAGSNLVVWWKRCEPRRIQSRYRIGCGMEWSRQRWMNRALVTRPITNLGCRRQIRSRDAKFERVLTRLPAVVYFAVKVATVANGHQLRTYVNDEAMNNM